MKSEVYYRIADIVLRVVFDFVFPAQSSYMKNFLVEPCEPDYTLRFCQTEDIPSFLKETPTFVGEVAKFHYYQNQEGTEACFHVHDGYYHAVTILGTDSGVCHYLSVEWLKEEIERGNHLENFFCIEKLLMRFDAMILHSCHIQKNKQSILFTAPSGTGKSTQGELWQIYKGAEIINGDRTIIRKKNDAWYAYGAPFCGTSNINLNRQAPIKAIVVLQQASYDYAERIYGHRAFVAIYSELTVNSWNDTFVRKALDWVIKLSEETKIYYFLCTKNSGAVDALESVLYESSALKFAQTTESGI